MAAGCRDGSSPFIAYLLGYPGVGKYTIGRALSSRTGAVLVDNHVVNHPILVLFDWDGKSPLPAGTLARTAPIRNAVLSALDEIAPRSMSYVFTNALEDKPEDVAIYERLEGIARRRGARFLPVLLTCRRNVQLRRVASEERSRRFKVSSPESVEQYMATTALYCPDDPNRLTLDTTDLSPAESATLITERLGQLS